MEASKDKRSKPDQLASNLKHSSSHNHIKDKDESSQYTAEVEAKLKELMGKLQKKPEASVNTAGENHGAAKTRIKPPSKSPGKFMMPQANMGPPFKLRQEVSSQAQARPKKDFKPKVMITPKPVVKKPEPMPLPSLFLKLPPSELPKATYKIKWFAPEHNFKGKFINLKIGAILGKGSFATVYDAYDEDLKQPVAVKIFDKRFLKDKSKRKEVQDELDLISKLNHPSIIKLERVVEDMDKIYIVLENWGRYNLEDYLKEEKLDRSKFKDIFRQLVEAVLYLHGHNVFHRDVKLANVMIKNGKICLLDFGLAANSNYVREFLQCGTPVYMPPEMHSKQGYEGAPIDAWCVAVCIFKALTGKYPFGGRLSAHSKNTTTRISKQISSLASFSRTCWRTSLKSTSSEKHLLLHSKIACSFAK